MRKGALCGNGGETRGESAQNSDFVSTKKRDNPAGLGWATPASPPLWTHASAIWPASAWPLWSMTSASAARHLKGFIARTLSAASCLTRGSHDNGRQDGQRQRGQRRWRRSRLQKQSIRLESAQRAAAAGVALHFRCERDVCALVLLRARKAVQPPGRRLYGIRSSWRYHGGTLRQVKHQAAGSGAE